MAYSPEHTTPHAALHSVNHLSDWLSGTDEYLAEMNSGEYNWTDAHQSSYESRIADAKAEITALSGLAAQVERADPEVYGDVMSKLAEGLPLFSGDTPDYRASIEAAYRPALAVHTPPPPGGTGGGYDTSGYREYAPFSDPGSYQRLSEGDYNALQQALYDGATAGLNRQESLWRDQADQSMSNRGIWSSGAAQMAQNDITGQLASVYQQAGSNAAAQRYGLEQSDNAGYNQYNLARSGMQNDYNTGGANAYNQYALSTGNLALGNKQADQSYALGNKQADQSYALGNLGASTNQYQAETGRIGTDNQYRLGLQSNANQLQGINDSYALNRAQMLNDANAQASNSQWQAQWAPANFLSGVWNGTGGTISSGSSGGGWNFMI